MWAPLENYSYLLGMRPSRDRITDVRNARKNGAILWFGFLVLHDRTEFHRGEMLPRPFPSDPADPGNPGLFA